MASNIRKVAALLGAKLGPRVPEVGAGAFGAARLSAVLTERLRPGRGLRPGRPGVRDWTARPKVPMSRATEQKLRRLARLASRGEPGARKVTPMQVAAQLLEEAVAGCNEAG